MWRRTYGRTDARTKSGKPHVGRPLLGPAKISGLKILCKKYLITTIPYVQQSFFFKHLKQNQNIYGVHILCLCNFSKISYQSVNLSNVLLHLKMGLAQYPHYLYCPPIIPKLTGDFFSSLFQALIAHYCLWSKNSLKTKTNIQTNKN